MRQVLHCDANATYGLLPEVREGVPLFLAQLEAARCANPSSVHQGGQWAKTILEEVREIIREVGGLSPDYRIIFTSGATEANNAMFFSVAHHVNTLLPDELPYVVTSSVEHPSVLAAAERVAALGGIHSIFRVSEWDETYKRVLEKKPHLFSLMAANNETGEIFDVKRVFSTVRARSPSTLCHSDCVQLIGKDPRRLDDLDSDAITFSGHKVGALPGVGVLAIKKSLPFSPLLVGGSQELYYRAGTENIPAVWSLGKALSVWQRRGEEMRASMRRHRDHVRHALLSEFPEARQVGEPLLPQTVAIHFPGIRADDLVVALDLENVLVSSGAACASGKPQPSHVYLECGLTEKEAKETIRFSLTADSYDELPGRVIAVVKNMYRAR
jgi:cysteine desulfurase